MVDNMISGYFLEKSIFLPALKKPSSKLFWGSEVSSVRFLASSYVLYLANFVFTSDYSIWLRVVSMKLLVNFGLALLNFRDSAAHVLRYWEETLMPP